MRKTVKNHIDSVRRMALGAGLLAGLAATLTGPPALAADKTPQTPCFFINQWRSWKAPNENTLYLGVGLHDVYRVDLSAGSPQLMWPDAHLISRTRGPSSVCSALDLQLSVSYVNDGRGLLRSGFEQGLIARKLTKLTPDEIAAIPQKYRPN